MDTRTRDSTSFDTYDVSVSNVGRDSPDSISTVDTELVFTRTAKPDSGAAGVATWEVKKIQVGAAAVFRAQYALPAISVEEPLTRQDCEQTCVC